jgi:hypothetical protein
VIWNKLAHKLQNAWKTFKNENMQHVQTISGHAHKISGLEDKFEQLNTKYHSFTSLYHLYEGVISSMMRPPSKLVDTITFGKYRKIAEDKDPNELMEFLQSTGLYTKISNLGENFKTIVEAMNELKKVFEDIKMIPERPIVIGEFTKFILDPTWITIRRIDLNDRILNSFHEAFIAGAHAWLLNQREKEEESPVKERKALGKKKKKDKKDNMFTKNEIEEKKQEIKEISEDIQDNMKYLVENKYSLQLKKMRRNKKDVILEQEQQELINKQLELSNFRFYP